MIERIQRAWAHAALLLATGVLALAPASPAIAGDVLTDDPANAEWSFDAATKGIELRERSDGFVSRDLVFVRKAIATGESILVTIKTDASMLMMLSGASLATVPLSGNLDTPQKLRLDSSTSPAVLLNGEPVADAQIAWSGLCAGDAPIILRFLGATQIKLLYDVDHAAMDNAASFFGIPLDSEDLVYDRRRKQPKPAQQKATPTEDAGVTGTSTTTTIDEDAPQVAPDRDPRVLATPDPLDAGKAGKAVQGELSLKLRTRTPRVYRQVPAVFINAQGWAVTAYGPLHRQRSADGVVPGVKDELDVNLLAADPQADLALVELTKDDGTPYRPATWVQVAEKTPEQANTLWAVRRGPKAQPVVSRGGRVVIQWDRAPDGVAGNASNDGRLETNIDPSSDLVGQMVLNGDCELVGMLSVAEKTSRSPSYVADPEALRALIAAAKKQESALGFIGALREFGQSEIDRPQPIGVVVDARTPAGSLQTAMIRVQRSATCGLCDGKGTVTIKHHRQTRQGMTVRDWYESEEVECKTCEGKKLAKPEAFSANMAKAVAALVTLDMADPATPRIIDFADDALEEISRLGDAQTVREMFAPLADAALKDDPADHIGETVLFFGTRESNQFIDMAETGVTVVGMDTVVFIKPKIDQTNSGTEFVAGGVIAGVTDGKTVISDGFILAID